MTNNFVYKMIQKIFVPLNCLVVPVCFCSCNKVEKDDMIRWSGLKTEPYIASYQQFNKDQIALENSLRTYTEFSKNNINDVLGQDVLHTISSDNYGNPETIWKCASKGFPAKIKPNKILFSYYVEIRGDDDDTFNFSIKVENMPYYATKISNHEENELAFLPLNISFNGEFNFTDEFWNDPAWELTLSTYDSSKEEFVDKVYSYKVFSPTVKEEIHDYLPFLAIYPHYFDKCEVV